MNLPLEIKAANFAREMPVLALKHSCDTGISRVLGRIMTNFDISRLIFVSMLEIMIVEPTHEYGSETGATSGKV